METMWERYLTTREVQARNDLVERYIPLVRMMAQKVKATLPPSVDNDDLESAGTIGLMKAIDKFEKTRGTKFETFCSRRIRGAMIDHLRELDFMPRMARLRLQKFERTSRQMAGKLGRQPTQAEVASEMGLSNRVARSLRRDREMSVVSLDRCIERRDQDGHGRSKVWEDRKTATPLQFLEKQELREVIEKTLTRTERLVVMLYYYEKLTMREIGDTLDVTEARVCQIHGKIMRDLRKRLAYS